MPGAVGVITLLDAPLANEVKRIWKRFEAELEFSAVPFVAHSQHDRRPNSQFVCTN